ncbi:hypothetical protein cyc_08625 [Cyclospora cayetanensis]|uniref:Uncharacterized protein n=1 Tax=Cyclospora cayetanensis TaxID=88456 RepID=A0A1D3D705_9EIME|nr:hypothetical protein cyc_08625 [Cyclospora cayetanensis]
MLLWCFCRRQSSLSRELILRQEELRKSSGNAAAAAAAQKQLAALEEALGDQQEVEEANKQMTHQVQQLQQELEGQQQQQPVALGEARRAEAYWRRECVPRKKAQRQDAATRGTAASSSRKLATRVDAPVRSLLRLLLASGFARVMALLYFLSMNAMRPPRYEESHCDADVTMGTASPEGFKKSLLFSTPTHGNASTEYNIDAQN